MAVLECGRLSKRFGRIHALDDVSLQVQAGRITGLLGPNGSGKTTLIKLVCGLLVPDAGSCRVLGYEPGRESKALVSYLPDRTVLPGWMTMRQLIRYWSDFYADFDIYRAEQLAEELGIRPDQPVKNMSRGTVEKVQLLLVMSRRAALYLLDEPLSGVDPAARDFILHTILSNSPPDAAVLISTHLIADVEPVLDDVIFIRNGSILLSAPAEEIRREHGESVDAYFREVFRV